MNNATFVLFIIFVFKFLSLVPSYSHFSVLAGYNLPVFPTIEKTSSLPENWKIPKVVYRAVSSGNNDLSNIFNFTYINSDWDHIVYDNVRFLKINSLYYTKFLLETIYNRKQKIFSWKLTSTKRVYYGLIIL